MNENKLNRQKRIFTLILKALMIISITVTVLLVAWMIIFVLYRGFKGMTWHFIVSKPSYINENIGIWPNIVNTIYIVFTTIIIVIPAGTAAAIYLNEYGKNKKIIKLIEYASETLSAIPSIIYGLVGMLVFSNNIGTSILAGCLTLVIMNLPTVMRTVQESLKTVPDSYREGAYALSAGKFRMITTVVIPGCIDGIVTSCILAIGRIISESAALIYTAGISNTCKNYFSGLFSSGASLTVALYVYAKEQGEIQVGYQIAAILMILTFLINILTVKIASGLKKRRTS
ncbi:MAG: phosphate ABC transporter permease PstA [Erysipelotrichaceae bacterium]